MATATSKFTLSTVKERERWLKILIYGDYGVGKTMLSGTAVDVPNMKDVFLINAESGDLTLDSEEHDFDEIQVAQVKDFKQAARMYEFLKLHCQFRDEENWEKLAKLQSQVTGEDAAKLQKNKDDIHIFRTAIIDSLTELEQYCMNQLLGISDLTALDEETASAEWGEYKRNHSMMLRLVRNFRDLPMHVVITCSRNFVQDETKKMLFSPAMTGKLSNQIQGFMDMVGYLATGAAQDDGSIPRRLYVQPTGKFAAKCRFSRYKQAFFDNPTMADIVTGIGLEASTK